MNKKELKRGFRLNNLNQKNFDFLFFRSYLKATWFLVLGLVFLFLDFFSKAYVFHVLSNSGQCFYRPSCLDIPVFHIGGIYFSIAFALNKGAAWGLFSNFQLLLLGVRFCVIAGMLVYLFFINKNKYAQIPLILIIAGAIGNVVDYFLYGFVIDFLHFNLWGYEFPVFNFADSMITIGVIWLLFLAPFNKKKTECQ